MNPDHAKTIDDLTAALEITESLKEHLLDQLWKQQLVSNAYKQRALEAEAIANQVMSESLTYIDLLKEAAREAMWQSGESGKSCIFVFSGRNQECRRPGTKHLGHWAREQNYCDKHAPEGCTELEQAALVRLIYPEYT